MTVLLSLLGEDLADSLLNQLPAARSETIRQQMARLTTSPPTEEEIDDILNEFDRLLRLFDTVPLPEDAEDELEDHADGEQEEQINLTGNSLEDLKRISPARLAAALRNESAPVIALLMQQIPEERAAEVLQCLSDEKRYDTFLQMRAELHAPMSVINRLAEASVARSAALPADAVRLDDEDIDTKLAKLLRSMDRKQQFAIMGSFQEEDADAASRLRGMMYVCEDLIDATDRTLQQVLSEVDTRTLATMLSDAEDELREKVFSNLSKRASQSLREELDLMSSVNPDDLEEAKQAIIKVMAEMDQNGQLEMNSG